MDPAIKHEVSYKCEKTTSEKCEMANTLSNWLNHIKDDDDIDGGLADDFDGSLSGLGVELGSSTYNMSEALLALPVFKADVDYGFQYILSSSTSPATKINEETLTYLNQGQSYEIKLKKLGSDTRGTVYKSTVRVIFHDKRLQFNERAQLSLWTQAHPGERIIDLDIPLCYGLRSARTVQDRINMAVIHWQAGKDAGVFIKVNCISTEFTAKKHGGEKGVPFRIQIETILSSESGDGELLHCASCQVKVFKPKGADRKNKTDRDKLEKRSEEEKGKYQPSYECTVLVESPLEQVKTYQDRVNVQNQTDGGKEFLKTILVMTDTEEKDSNGVDPPSFHSLAEENLKPEPDQPRLFKIPSAGSIVSLASPLPDLEETEALEQDSTAEEVTKWLHSNRFGAFVRVFQNFSGADLLRLSRDDLIQICGLADGIRLNNALQSKNVRPKLRIYVCQEPPSTPVKARPQEVTPNTSFSNLNLTTSSVSSFQPGYSSDSSSTPISLSCSTSETRPSSHPTSSKRHYVEADHVEDDEIMISKKQRTRNLELSRKYVYHAVYLHHLTLADLTEKLANLFSIHPSQIVEIHVQGPSGIHVLVQDSVVQNFEDQSLFVIETTHDEDTSENKYRLLLKSLE